MTGRLLRHGGDAYERLHAELTGATTKAVHSSTAARRVFHPKENLLASSDARSRDACGLKRKLSSCSQDVASTFSSQEDSCSKRRRLPTRGSHSSTVSSLGERTDHPALSTTLRSCTHDTRFATNGLEFSPKRPERLALARIRHSLERESSIRKSDGFLPIAEEHVDLRELSQSSQSTLIFGIDQALRFQVVDWLLHVVSGSVG